MIAHRPTPSSNPQNRQPDSHLTPLQKYTFFNIQIFFNIFLEKKGVTQTVTPKYATIRFLGCFSRGHSVPGAPRFCHASHICQIRAHKIQLRYKAHTPKSSSANWLNTRSWP